MIAFKWIVVILTVAVSALFVYLTGKEKDKKS